MSDHDGDALLVYKVEQLTRAFEDLKATVESLRDESIVYRIKQLEAWRNRFFAVCTALGVALAGAWFVVLFR